MSPQGRGDALASTRSRGRSGRVKTVQVEVSSGGGRRLGSGPQRLVFRTGGAAAGFDFGSGPDFNGEVRGGSQQFADILHSMEQVLAEN